MMRRRHSSFFVAALAIALACELARSPQTCAQPRRTLVATRLEDVDADFHIQGEYLGRIGPGAFGVQIAALGGGTFTALAYRGGLPGNGWDRSEPLRLDGKRTESGPVVLAGGQTRVIVSGSRATAVDRHERPTGRFERVKRYSGTLGAAPTTNAISLFDVDGPHHLEKAGTTPDDLLMAGTISTLTVQDFRLHVEFRLPYMPDARDQGRANSGVYVQKRYEIQILDSFGLEPLFNGCGALYRQQSPDLNMSFPPLSWQTYDIYFTAARWDAAGNKLANARVTVLHNGVAIHSDREVVAKTGAGDRESPAPGPIRFQDHNNPVVFRNIWIEPFLTNPPPMKVARNRRSR